MKGYKHPNKLTKRCYENSSNRHFTKNSFRRIHDSSNSRFAEFPILPKIQFVEFLVRQINDQSNEPRRVRY